MSNFNGTEWTELSPPLDREAMAAYRKYARVLLGLWDNTSDHSALVEEARRVFARATSRSNLVNRQMLEAAGLVLTDLVLQGWQLRIRRARVEVCEPVQLREDRGAEKERIRRQELIKRDSQIQEDAVRRFLRAMERPRFFAGKPVSIFSLMRDGRELAQSLRRSHGQINGLTKIVDPYLLFVESDSALCPFTGIRIMDIWRYFRHTWTNQYRSVPGRTMMFIVRDRAAALHPVMGIGALSSPVVQIRERDAWIGWEPEVFLERVREEPSTALGEWLTSAVNAAIEELYVTDFFEDGILSSRDLAAPNDALIERLRDEGIRQRRLHYRCARSRDHKAVRQDASDQEHWALRARTHLFRSKRAAALAGLLRAREALKEGLGTQPSPERIRDFTSKSHGQAVIRTVLRKVKADRIGIAVAEITVCGAIQPYNAILGGKLVAMLATSPEVVLEYRRRYSEAESEIASSMAGRPIIRRPTLVLLATTSLYGTGSSQYNRIKIPCDRLGSPGDAVIQYAELGHSEAYGTSQYSEQTVRALTDLVQQSAQGQRVNSIFGEGVSPKLRKVRQGLDLLNFRPGRLLRHHRRRVVYAVTLVRNLREYLLGLENEPRYLIPLNDGQAATAQIAEWWRERWLRNRIKSEAHLAEVSRHTLVRPIRHGARVISPLDDQQELFPDMSV